MRSPRLTEENLANQIAVVKEEIRVNVLNRPYGGFPWLELPPVLYDTFANSHNGYGGFVDLESATVKDAADFFDTYYAPANAVLAVGGDLDPDEAIAMIEKHFGDIAKRPAPIRPDFSEPEPATERRGQAIDHHAPIPAVAIGYRVPDPVSRFHEHLANLLLAEVLSDGDASRLNRQLVQRGHLVTDVSAYLGEFGDPFDERDPTPFTITAHYPEAENLQPILDAVDAELLAIADEGLEPGELDRVRTRLVSSLLREIDAVLARTLSIAKFELIFGRAELLNDLPALLAEVTDADVAEAARRLRPDHRAVVELIAGGAQGGDK
jgi:zinc protease